MPRKRTETPFGTDSNGCLTERIEVDDQTVIVHYDDIPESDVTAVRGIACTTPLCTVIDIAPGLNPVELDDIVRDCVRRGLFTVEQAPGSLAQPDMASHRGADVLRTYLAR